MSSERPYLVVIGAPGAGKTRVGKRVARLLRVPFIDTDRRIVMRHGPIAQIFTGRGEDHFRKLERLEVQRATADAPNLVADISRHAALARRRVVHVVAIG